MRRVMFTKKVFPFILAGFLATASIACDDSQEITDENGGQGGGQGGGNEGGTTPYMVDVLRGEEVIQSVDVASMTTKEVTQNGEKLDVVPVSDIIAKANQISDNDLDDFLAKYLCDYEGENGFRPSSKPDRCPPISCSFSKMSYVSTQSERLFHDEAATELQVGCYSVKAISKVILIDADASAE